MDPKAFGKNSTGKLVPSDLPDYREAFLPNPLPPTWEWPERLWPILKEASVELARLDGIGRYIQTPELLLRPLQRREAIKSSSLEGTYVSAQELLLFEIERKTKPTNSDRIHSWMEVFNYSQALKVWGETREKMPISRRVICSLHEVLMTGVRGGSKMPGCFRRSSVQIGRPARFIPPPAQYVDDCISDLERYIHGERKLDCLVDAFVVHYQFEAIHPFLDGNGRVGRLLLSITIDEWCKLSAPWLYMSEYFEKRKDEYMDRLLAISTRGEWEGWIEFCLKGVVEEARETVARCTKIVDLKREYHGKIQNLGGNLRLLAIVDGLFDNPMVRIAGLAKTHGVSYPTAKADVERLSAAQILAPIEDVYPAAYYSPEIFRVAYGE